MKLRFFFVLFFLIYFTYSQSNENQINNDSIKIDEAKRNHKKAVTFYVDKNYYKALNLLLKEEKIFLKLKLYNVNYYKSLYLIAKVNKILGENAIAIKYYKKYLLFKKIKDKKRIRILNTLANLNEKQGNLIESVLYRKELIKRLRKTRNLDKLFLQLLNLHVTLDNISDTKSLSLQKRVLDSAGILLKQFKYKPEDIYDLNINYALYYLNDSVKDYNKVKTYYFKSLKLSLAKKDSVSSSVFYNNLAELYIRKHNDSALYFLDKSLSFNKKIITNYYFNLSNYYSDKKQYVKSVNTIQKAINSTLKSPFDYKSPIPLNVLINATNKVLVCELLKSKNETLINLYKKNKDLKYLRLTLQNVDLIDQLISFIKDQSIISDSKLYWQNFMSNLFFSGVYCAKNLNMPEKAFLYIEKNKALLLLNETIENDLKSNIPILIRNNLSQIKKEIYLLENSINNKEISNAKNNLFKLRLQLETQTDSLQKIYPEYFKYKDYTPKLVKFEEIKKQLKPNELILTFIASDDSTVETNLISLLIGKDITKFTFVDNNIKSLINKYNYYLSKPIQTKVESEEFKQISNKIFNNIFSTDKVKEIIKNKKIIILPDGLLQNVSFEAFITNNNNYLIKESNITYAYSITYLLKNLKTKRQPSKTFLAIAPIYFKNNLEPLEESKQEITNLKNIYSVESYIQKDATKNNFLNNCNNFNVIHLATHAKAIKNDMPWIAFNDDKLLLNELYTTEIQADLVVLSACDTSLGEIAKGEGVLSLARGFFYSGANTVVSTLWNVNDKASAIIMNDFYKNLKKGKTKSDALRDAKIYYLENHSQEDASPYYWSSFILIGDANNLATMSNANSYYYIFGFLLVIVAIFLFWKIKK